MEIAIALLAGIPIGFVLGVICVKMWPGKLAADYVVMKTETDKLAKFLGDGLTEAHTKLDAIAKKVGIIGV